MRITSLEVVDFRNHPAAALEPQAGVNVLVGLNGAGKTSLLEAAAFLATLDTHRVGQEAALVRSGSPAAVVRGQLLRAGRRVVLECELRPGARLRTRVNQAPVPRARDFVGVLRAVLFAPEDLALVRGDPDERRRLLDLLLTQRRPGYLPTRQDYERVLRQRNALLKSAGGRMPSAAGLATLEVWDEKLAAVGAEIWLRRRQLVDALGAPVATAYRELAERDDDVRLRYVAAAVAGADADDQGPPPEQSALAAILLERLTANRAREIERGVTLSGPHRDDLALAVRGLPARSHASHGEAWTLALALRLAGHRWLREDGEEPVLLLDDVFAELDRRRRARLAAAVMTVEQAIISAAVAEELPPGLEATRFRVAPGSVVREDAG